jgi:hypothetical protein
MSPSWTGRYIAATRFEGRITTEVRAALLARARSARSRETPMGPVYCAGVRYAVR